MGHHPAHGAPCLLVSRRAARPLPTASNSTRGLDQLLPGGNCKQPIKPGLDHASDIQGRQVLARLAGQQRHGLYRRQNHPAVEMVIGKPGLNPDADSLACSGHQTGNCRQSAMVRSSISTGIRLALTAQCRV